jgi:cell division protein FtsB
MDQFIATIRTWALGARRRLAIISVSALILFFSYHVVFGANGLLVYRQKRQQSRAIQQQIENMQQQNAALEKQIKALKSDPQAIEKEARESLHYARPGEVVYTLPSPTHATNPPNNK